MKTKMLCAMVALGLVTLLLSGCGGGGGTTPPAQVTVTAAGSVVDTNNAVISGASVTIGGVTGTTNASGLYSLSNVATGNQTVVVTATGFTQPGVPPTVTIVNGANNIAPVVMVATAVAPPPPPAP
jgi:hypothetical protein